MEEALLIALVEQHPNIYDKTRKDFRDNKKKENSWEEIAAAMQAEVAECQRIWKNIRDHYTRERRKRKHTESGMEAPESTWSLFTSLEFLEKYIQPRKTTSNVKRPESAASSSRCSSSTSGGPLSPYDSIGVITLGCEESTEEISNSYVEVPSATSCEETDPSTAHVATDKSRVTPTTSVPSVTPSTSGRRKKQATDLEDRLGVAIDAMADFLKNKQEVPHNPRETFANFVASELGQLSKEKEKWAKRKILQVLQAAVEESDDE